MAKVDEEEVRKRIEEIRPKLKPENAAVLDELTPEDKASLLKNVTAENIDIIQSWIGR